MQVSGEGSLFLTVVVSLDAKRSGRGGGIRGEHERAGKGGGGGSGCFAIW